jgi:hypothetical protein
MPSADDYAALASRFESLGSEVLAAPSALRSRFGADVARGGRLTADIVFILDELVGSAQIVQADLAQLAAACRSRGQAIRDLTRDAP